MATNNSVNSATPLSVSAGGTGQTTLTNHGILVGAGTSGITQLTVGGANSILVGTAGADPSFTTTGTVYASGISFDSGSNTLSTYTVSTWTPTLTGASTAGTTTYTNQTGYYTRIGNLIWVMGNINISAATGTGDATIGGLPFTIKSQTNGNPLGNIYFDASGWAWPASTTTFSVQGINNTTTAVLSCFGNGVAVSNMQMTNAAITSFKFAFFYQI